ncbi:HAMP domain-containing histidine kinase [Brevibacillus antibioticus]|uniref:histidine kinase n=1 Tax=Brevibacillus antibioticus TaxID=2570228 RepID=A0A4V5TKR9_9BACL|nr:HAMP domain-containing sensor histidine kinase [Brevibacillus antibioticus]TKI56773.1 HAMP domain-containing histidine kinase [Brevibacillus antibioticus]
MNWRVTGRFLASVVLIVILVVLSNIVLLVLSIVVTTQTGWDETAISEKGNSAEAITSRFHEQIIISNHQATLTDKGKAELDQHNAWIQILDEDGKQIFGYRLPVGIKEKYTPIDIIQMYKYKEIDRNTMVFIGEKQTGSSHYSYFIGFQNRNLQRYVLAYDIQEVVQVFNIGSILVLTVDGLIALIVGYFFSKRLTKPLLSLIEGIRKLANKEYHINYEPIGIYKDVFYNVNYLSYELRAAENERKKLDTMREEWIGNVSHDLKTPLASIQGYAEMMKDTEYDFSCEEMREFAEIIERKSLYLKDVIEDLNLSARLKNKELRLHKSNKNIVTLLRNVVIDTLNDARYADRNMEFQFSDEMIKVDMDEILIRRAITNLIYNAIVHNDPSVLIKVSVEKGQRTLIRIEDNGKGMKEQELDRIFDRYYRGTNTGELHKGSGLGMAIARDIIVAHGGEIKVNSLLGLGTKIEIQL